MNHTRSIRSSFVSQQSIRQFIHPSISPSCQFDCSFQGERVKGCCFCCSCFALMQLSTSRMGSANRITQHAAEWIGFLSGWMYFVDDGSITQRHQSPCISRQSILSAAAAAAAIFSLWSDGQMTGHQLRRILKEVGRQTKRDIIKSIHISASFILRHSSCSSSCDCLGGKKTRGRILIFEDENLCKGNTSASFTVNEWEWE